MLSLRGRISSDLHDEVGSNLATIALLSELGPDPGNLDDINRLSRETSLALREIVDITLAPERARKPLLDRLRDIATLMLRDHQWSFEGGDAPVFDLEQRRNLVFYFKESLHNIIRHAGAKSVRIVFENAPPDFRLIIEDDGKGIQTSSPDVMGNLNTLRQRAESLRGKFEVDSKPGEGTRLTLAIPIHHRK
jgi:signal transduction histidine kinase